MTHSKHIQASIVAIVLCLLCFELTPLDFQVQDYFFNPLSHTWWLETSQRTLYTLLYEAPKKLLVLLELTLIITLLFFRKARLVRGYHTGLLILLLALPLGPALVSSLKGSSNVACPYALQEYGGDIPHIGLFQAYPPDMKPDKRQRCFPAGHASGGFALMALYYLPKTQRRKRQALAFAIIIGWIMGGYKMLLGHHFLSHTMMTMLLSWLVINCVALMATPHAACRKSAEITLKKVTANVN